MRFLKSFAAVILTVMIACGGGKSNDSIPIPNNPTSKSYGTFRNLAPKTTSALIAEKGNNQLVNADGTVTITGRINHRAILMLNGKVLLWGGDSDPYNPSLDIYDPVTESFVKSNAIPAFARYNRKGSGESYSAFGMCNLPNGNVIVIGGCRGWGDTSYWEEYNPNNDSITKHNTTLNWGSVEELLYVGNNKVIVFQSGYGGSRWLNLVTNEYDSFLYPEDPITDSSIVQDNAGDIWSIGGQWGVFPYWDTLISKPYILKFNKVSQVWERKVDLLTARHDTTVVLLSDNKIGIYGGKRTVYNPSYPNTITTNLKSVEIYDIVNNTISYSTDIVGERQQAKSVYLQSGYTLIAGGADLDNIVVNTELVHKHDIGFSGSTGAMIHPRYGHSVVNLPNGMVLITGGSGGMTNDGVDKTAEIYDPQAKLYIKYLTEQIVVGNTLQLSTEYTAGVNWSLSDNTHADITVDGILTANSIGVVEVKATAKDDVNLTAVIRISIIPQ
jgi:hypothetical protein